MDRFALATVFKILILLSFLFSTESFANSCEEKNTCSCEEKDTCCGGVGGVLYCDSSAGRFVCKNGAFSDCYCTRHAVMNMQTLNGCCLWEGGVMEISPSGTVVCRSGAISELCSIITTTDRAQSLF